MAFVRRHAPVSSRTEKVVEVAPRGRRLPVARKPTSDVRPRSVGWSGLIGEADLRADRLTDPQHEGLGRRRAPLALLSEDVLQLRLEVGPMQARRTLVEVIDE